MAEAHHSHSHAHGPVHPDAARDPVCGMTVDPATTPHHAEHGEGTFHFCSAGCRMKFLADPAKHLAPRPSEPPPKPGTIYTCPMHPEIRQDHPGACPICGMALEPVTVTVETGPSPELRDMTLRFWVGLALAVPVFVLEMGGHLMGHGLMDQRVSAWIQFALATPVALWAGWPSPRPWRSG